MLKAVLDAEGITQAELSRASGVNLTTINLICQGIKNNAKPSTKSRLVKGINALLEKDKYSVSEIFSAS